MIADDWYDRRQGLPGWDPSTNWFKPYPSREEFEALKKEVEELKKLLIKAKKQDEEEGNPNCEMEEKIDILRRLADVVGVDLEEVFTKN